MKNLLGVSPSKGYQGTTRGKEILITSVRMVSIRSHRPQPLDREGPEINISRDRSVS